MPPAPPTPTTPSPHLTISLTTLQHLQAKPTGGPYSLNDISALSTEWRSLYDSTITSFNKLVTCKEYHTIHAFTVSTKEVFEVLCKEMKEVDARKVGQAEVDVFLERWEALVQLLKGEERGKGCERGHRGLVEGRGMYGWRDER